MQGVHLGYVAGPRRCMGGYQPTYVMIEGFSCILWCSDH